jgi:endoglucanase
VTRLTPSPNALRRTVKLVGLGCAGLVGLIVLVLAILSALGLGQLTLNLPVAHKPAFDCTRCGEYPARLSAEANALVGPDGGRVLLAGIMVPEPARLSRQGRFSADLFREIRGVGANVVRIPVDPDRWGTDPDYLWRYLDPAVTWAGEAGLYAIIDLHMIGNIETGEGTAMPDVPAKELATRFWGQVAAYFREAPHVVFELFNEPERIGPEAWQGAGRDLIATVRGQDARQLVVIGGTDFSSDLSWLMAEGALADDNLAYAVHVFPGTDVSWEAAFGAAAERYPVLMTEWGFMEENPSPTQAYLNGSADAYGEPLMAFLEERGIGWVAAWWDTEWEPPMLSSVGGYTGYGQFVLERLKEAAEKR